MSAPDLAAIVGGAGGAVLVVDGTTPPGCAAVERAFAEAPRVRHDAVAGTGLPGQDGEDCPLDAPRGGLDVLVAVDILDRVLEGPYAMRAALRLLPPTGRLLLVQQVSPDDGDERAAWNALARMRDARHTWSPSSRQLRAAVRAAPARAGREVEWTEVIDPAIGCRDETEALLGTYLAALSKGGGPLTGEGLPVRRVAIVLRPGR